VQLNRTYNEAKICMVKNLDAVCDAMTCSGHGDCVNGECVCDRLYSGEICQSKGITLSFTLISN
jgi:hypothetical protein